MSYRIGADVGGSFTDFAVFEEESGRLATLKVFSRPDAPGEEIAAGLAALAQSIGLAPGDIAYFSHGTTVGVNTVIQRSGHRLALFATKGFEDVLEVARLKVPDVQDLSSRRPEPLVAREHVFGVVERMGADGRVLAAPSPDSVERALSGALAAGCEAVVVSFLNAYRNGDNEEAVKEMVERLAPGLPVFTSSGTWPVIREYERTITAVIGGYVQPRVARYLDRFEGVLREKGVACPLRITKTNGGVMDIAEARENCVQMILSGTASGVIGAGHLARECGYDQVLSLDIGGTSADVTVIEKGEPQYGVGELIGDFQIHVPSVSVSSVGQGGGSIAWIDGLGILKVGPESAGSTPGPAAYGRGGKRPTVTDAMAAANLIGHMPLGYGAVSVDRQAARSAFAPLAERLGTSVEAVAGHVVDICVSGMYAEVSGLISRFGIDPREFHLFAFGGAGAMLAAFLARELGVKGVVVPPRPGVVSAFGGLIADLRNDFLKTVFREMTPAAMPVLAEALSELEGKALHWLREAQAYEGPERIRVLADMRFVGQSYEIETVLDPEWLREGDADAVTAAFRAEHERLFGHADAATPVQMVNLRLVIAGATPKPVLARAEEAASAPEPHLVADGFFAGQAWKTPVYYRDDLKAGHGFAGPAVVAQDDTTTIVPPDFSVSVDPFGNLVLAREG